MIAIKNEIAFVIENVPYPKMKMKSDPTLETFIIIILKSIQERYFSCCYLRWDTVLFPSGLHHYLFL